MENKENHRMDLEHMVKRSTHVVSKGEEKENFFALYLNSHIIFEEILSENFPKLVKGWNHRFRKL